MKDIAKYDHGETLCDDESKHRKIGVATAGTEVVGVGAGVEAVKRAVLSEDLEGAEAAAREVE